MAYTTSVPGVPGGPIQTSFPVKLLIAPAWRTNVRPGIKARVPRLVREVQAGKLAKQLSRLHVIRFRRILSCIKRSEMDGSLVELNARNPSLSVTPKLNTLISGSGAADSRIHHVLLMRREAEICTSHIERISVDMIDNLAFFGADDKTMQVRCNAVAAGAALGNEVIRTTLCAAAIPATRQDAVNIAGVYNHNVPVAKINGDWGRIVMHPWSLLHRFRGVVPRAVAAAPGLFACQNYSMRGA